MKTSLFGIKAIAKREGTILHVYRDSKGLPTAGVGHLITADEHAEFPVGKKISQAQSDAWLAADLKECEDAVNSLGVDLEQNEFDALVSLAFNIGVGAESGPHKGGFLHSTVARRLKAGDKHGAAEAILLWDKPPEIQGRRRTEYNQFLTPYKQDSAADPAASTTRRVSANLDPALPSEPSNSDPPPITTSVEQTQSQAVKTDNTTAVTQTTVTQEQPKGDAPDAPPTKISKNGPLAKWLTGSALIGIGTFAWNYIQANPTVVGTVSICVTVLILALVFRGTIIDAVRMQAASDPDKKNVT